MNIFNKITKAISLALNLTKENAESPQDRSIPVGGQAVIEGVLMKGPKRWGLAVRLENGQIHREHWTTKTWTTTKIGALPIIRGFLTMIEMLKVGFKAISRSAELALGEEENMTVLDYVITGVLATLLVVGLFIALPVYSADWIAKLASLPKWSANILEGIMRALVFIAYIAAIGLMPDIAKVFAYHGAEHKTINAYEYGSDMSVGSVMTYSRIHPRCGTSFLMIVVATSIIVFSLIGPGSILWRIGTRIVLIPLVIGISYEIIKAANTSKGFLKKAVAPTLCLQKLTTREPNPDQVQVAIESLEEALDTKF